VPRSPPPPLSLDHRCSLGFFFFFFFFTTTSRWQQQQQRRRSSSSFHDDFKKKETQRVGDANEEHARLRI